MSSSATRRLGRWIAALGRPLTYANVVATLALIVALGTGGAYAASKIGPRDIDQGAVRAKHLKNGSVATPKLAARAVTSAKLADGSVTAAKLADGAAAGPQGPQGPAGPAGVRWRGEWVEPGTCSGFPCAPVSYAKNDAVSHDGSSYIANAEDSTCAFVCQPPDASPKWELLAASGRNGAPGLPGSPGAKGDTGPPGLSGYQRVEATWTMSGGVGSIETMSIECPAGKRVLGGGALSRLFFSFDGGLRPHAALVGSYPNEAGTHWMIQVQDTWADGADPVGTIYAICATVSP